MEQIKLTSVKEFVARNKESLIILLVSSILWSWLFLIDVANLAHTLVLGYVLMIIVYIIMTIITTLFVIKTWEILSKILKKPSYKSICYMILLWAAIELSLAWVLSAIWMGKNGSWDNIVPFVSLTPLVVLTPFRYLTRVFGFFGTSAVIGVGLVLLVACVRNKAWRKRVMIYWALITVINIGLWAIYKTPSGPTIHAVITSEKLGEPQKINGANSDIVVLPEYGLDHYSSDNVTERFLPSDKEIFFTGTKQYGETNGNKNSLIYGSNRRGFIHEQAKSRLIVGGEYLPYTVEIAVRTISPNIYYDFQVRRSITRGHEAIAPFKLPNGTIIGNAACSSIINPDDYRKLTAAGATILANSASLEIFRGSRVFALHHDGLAKFMATANARPFLQSAHNWKAFALDHNGNKITQINPVAQQNVAVQTNNMKTPYFYLGEWVAYLGLLFIIAVVIRLGVKRRKS